MNLKKISLSNLIETLKDPNKKMYLYAFILGTVFILVLIIIVFAMIFGGKLKTYEQLETVMLSKAQQYAKDKKMLVKRDTLNRSIKIETLVQNKYMKNLKKYGKKYEQCSGNVTINYNGKYFLYTPYLKCGSDYTTAYLGDIIKQSKLNDNKDGLYPIDNYYIFRGENPNNYIKFAGGLWRIVKIEADGTIKIIKANTVFDDTIFDDRYNGTCPEEEYNCNGFSSFETSRLKEKMIDIFDNGVEVDDEKIKFSKFDKTIIKYQNICIGAAKEDLKITDGYPECKLKTENKYPFDFIKLNEYIMASLDSKCLSIKNRECTNYNFMKKGAFYWTATTIDKNNYQVYYIQELPRPVLVSENLGYTFVVNLSKNTLYEKGNGTENNPYVIREIKN